MNRVFLATGDVLRILQVLGDNSVDGCFTDPPYGIGFMGNEWDKNLPSVEVFTELLRVLKPGAPLLSFGHPRTFHRLAVNIEDAGFELRDTLSWFYGEGFPKNWDVSKAIDKRLGAIRKVIGTVKRTDKRGGNFYAGAETRPYLDYEVTIPATPDAKQWDGYGIGLKPAWEPIFLARKPLDGTIAENVMRWGCGELNIDRCRIGPGRFPANLILDEDAAALLDGQSGYSHSVDRRNLGKRKGRPSRFQGGRLDYSNNTYGDEGGASRFFYCAKVRAPRKDKERGRGNDHPTLKPLALCEYLARLILPPSREGERTLLVPYCGTGSEILGAMKAGWDRVMGIEINAAYVAVAKRRIAECRVSLGERAA